MPQSMLLPTLFARYRPSGLVSESESEVRADWHVVVQGHHHQNKLVWGNLNHRQRRVRRHPSEVDGLLRKTRLNRQGLGLKKAQNH
jgi:hypothetical protein